jgi:hypothetical protein
LPPWSFDLSPYGLQQTKGEKNPDRFPETRLAVTNRYVAVAIGTLPQVIPLKGPHGDFEVPWDVSLLVFDSQKGNLLVKLGPWKSDFHFELHTTARGNFLLHLPHYCGSQEHGETLRLIAPSGEEIEELQLAPASRDPANHPYNVMISSSRSSLLLRQVFEDGIHYRVVEADTFKEKQEWTDALESGVPYVIALSDKELLGLGSSTKQGQSGSASGERALFVRTLDGSWRSFPILLEPGNHSLGGVGSGPDDLAFLSNNVLVGLEPLSKSAPAKLDVARTDGTTVFSCVIPERTDAFSQVGPVSVSEDGHHFAVGVVHASWLGRFFDMTIANPQIPIWDNPTPIPVVNPCRRPVNRIPPLARFLSARGIGIEHFENHSRP